MFSTTLQTVRARLRNVYRTGLPFAFLAVAAANVVATFFLPPSGWPIRGHESGSLTHLVHTEQRAVDRRFGFYLELDDATEDGSTFVVPPGAPVNPELVDGLAEMRLEEREYDPAELGDLFGSPTPIGPLETDQGEVGYSLLPGEDDRWWLVTVGPDLLVVPETSLPAAAVEP